MPSFSHEAPLMLFRECPELAVRVLRELLGFDVPAGAPIATDESDLTQLTPKELRADLVLTVGGEQPVLGIILEVQRRIDARKRYAWPLYAAALHARLRCQVCLVVVTANPSVASWAARPIASHQLGSGFVPLVVGPDQVPRITDPGAAAEAPELAVLSALAHGREPGGIEVATAAIEAVQELDAERATLYRELIVGSLPARVLERFLEQLMLTKQDYLLASQRRWERFGHARGRKKGREEGREEGLRVALRALVRAKLGDVPPSIETRIVACPDSTELIGWIEAVGPAPDGAAVLAAFATDDAD